MNIRVGELSGSDATNALHETIAKSNEIASRQTQRIIVLTYAILFLTVVMTVMVAVQVWVALREPQPVRKTTLIITHRPRRKHPSGCQAEGVTTSQRP